MSEPTYEEQVAAAARAEMDAVRAQGQVVTAVAGSEQRARETMAALEAERAVIERILAEPNATVITPETIGAVAQAVVRGLDATIQLSGLIVDMARDG